ncbi:MAG: S8 family serine peptidase [Gemmatimonadetes bacterium]|nr:S8 family serine peptidase [Gemmatimonadota bacterium]
MGTLLALSILAGAAEAQQPTVSPAVERLLQRDSTVAVWLFVRPAYPLEDVADAVVRAGGTVRRRSEWLHALSANVTRAALSELRRDLRLERIQPVARFRRPPLPPPGAIPPVPRAPPITAQGGYRGAGVRIAMLDTGFETDHPAFASAKVIAQRDFVFNDAVVSNQPNDAAGASRHGTATWSLLAANVPGTLIGIAPEAQYILAKTEDVRSETHAEEDNFVAALEWAASLDAKVVSASLGYLVGSDFGYTFSQLNGDIAVTTIASDLAAQRGITVVNSVGNDGPNPRTLGTPADGDSVIAVGAEDSTGTLAAFSSRGPTADGRIKPDVTAPGVQVWVLDTQAAGGFSRLNGTSFAAPLIAGAAALLREIHPQLTGVEVGDALRRAGNGAPRPDNNRGWGLPDGLTAATFPYGIVVSSPRDSLLTAVTPTFAWSTPGVPPFGNPVSYRLTVSRADTSPQVVLLDTALSSTQATLGLPQRPGRRLSFALQALSADSAVLAFTPDAQFVVPAWADLLTLDDPGGTTVRDPRPTLRWTAPAVVSPPGPFTFDVEVFRTDNREVVIRRTGLDTTAHTLTSDLELNTPYRWRVVSHLGSDTATTESQGAFVVVDGSVPPVTLLFQNFPNPFPNPGLGLVPQGVYLVKLATPDGTFFKRIVFLGLP